jgi:hypothetical protein
MKNIQNVNNMPANPSLFVLIPRPQKEDLWMVRIKMLEASPFPPTYKVVQI